MHTIRGVCIYCKPKNYVPYDYVGSLVASLGHLDSYVKVCGCLKYFKRM